MLKKSLRTYSFIAIICFLTGCGKSSYKNFEMADSDSTSLSDIDTISIGDYSSIQNKAVAKANRFLKLAKDTDSPSTQNIYLLKAADCFIVANMDDRAAKILHTMPRKLGSPTEDSYKQILKAQVAMQQHDSTNALQLLHLIKNTNDLNDALKYKLHQVKAEAHLRSGNHLESAKERIKINDFLNSEIDQNNNNRVILDTLSQLTPGILHTVEQESNSSIFNGWVSLSYLTKQYDTSPDQMTRALQFWQQKYPNHPATTIMPNLPQIKVEAMAQNMAESQQEQEQEQFGTNIYQDKTLPLAKDYRQPKRSFNREQIILNQPRRIALLLPFEGPFASSSRVIRDGFLAAYYNKINKQKPEILIFDTSKYKSISKIYQIAIDEQVDFIVGPLPKEDVEAISRLRRLPIPVLALNSIEKENNHHPLLFQFGLAPEIEATSVANKAWQDGHKNALIIVPASTWGNRMHTAFEENWQQFGGNVINVMKISSKDNLNTSIKNILNVQNSENRAKKLQQSGIKINFKPRHRKDIDMIFLATNPNLARQLKPLLNFHWAKNIPVYSSSNIYKGFPSTIRDQDLNGIKFCDMPWVLDKSISSRKIYRSIEKLFPSTFNEYIRLYAFSIDSYRLAFQIQQLTYFKDFGISGMTGILKLDHANRITRNLMWANFKDGFPQLHGPKRESRS